MKWIRLTFLACGAAASIALAGATIYLRIDAQEKRHATATLQRDNADQSAQARANVTQTGKATEQTLDSYAAFDTTRTSMKELKASCDPLVTQHEADSTATVTALVTEAGLEALNSYKPDLIDRPWTVRKLVAYCKSQAQ